MVDIGPSGIYYYYVDPANTSMFYRITRAVVGDLNPRLRRAIGLRRWNVYGRVGFKDKRVKLVVGTAMVEGSHEWLNGGWALEQTIPPSEIDSYVTRRGVPSLHPAKYSTWGMESTDRDVGTRIVEGKTLVSICPRMRQPKYKRSAHMNRAELPYVTFRM